MEGCSFISSTEGEYLTRCYDCGQPNLPFAMMSGVCVWCGYNVATAIIPEGTHRRSLDQILGRSFPAAHRD